MSRINGEKARASIARKRRTVRRIKEREIREKLLAARTARLASPPPAPKPVTEARKPVEVKAEPTKPVEVTPETAPPTGPPSGVAPKKKKAAKKPTAAPAASTEKTKEAGKKTKPATPSKPKG